MEELNKEIEMITFYGEIVTKDNKELMAKVCEAIKAEIPMYVQTMRAMLSMLASLYLEEHTEA